MRSFNQILFGHKSVLYSLAVVASLSSCTKNSLNQAATKSTRTDDSQEASISPIPVATTTQAEPTASAPGQEFSAGATPDRIIRTLSGAEALLEIAVDPGKATVSSIKVNDKTIDPSTTTVSLTKETADVTKCGAKEAVIGSDLPALQISPNTTYNVTVCEKSESTAAGTDKPLITDNKITTPAEPLKIVSAEIESDTLASINIDTGKNPIGTEVSVSVFSEQEEGWIDLKTGKVSTDESKKWQPVTTEILTAAKPSASGTPIIVVKAVVDTLSEPVFVVQSRNIDLVESSESPAVVAHPKGTPVVFASDLIASSNIESSIDPKDATISSTEIDKVKFAALSPNDKLKLLRKTLRLQREELYPLKVAVKDSRRDEKRLVQEQTSLKAKTDQTKDKAQITELQKKIDEVAKLLADLESKEKTAVELLKASKSKVDATRSAIKEVKLAMKSEKPAKAEKAKKAEKAEKAKKAEKAENDKKSTKADIDNEKEVIPAEKDSKKEKK